jgi:endonuclease/exonuclease/phosphatase family metal-dependent hydrolase
MAGGAVVPTLIQPVVLDGDITEWPPSVVMTTDQWWVYLRWKVTGEAKSLQASDESLSIWLDLDTNPATGHRPTAPRGAAQMGIDLGIEFSPIADDGSGASRGVRVTTHTAAGTTEITHDQVEFSFAPTYASEWYEGRISRHALAGLGLPVPRAGGLMTGMFALRDSSGGFVGSSDPFEVEATAASATAPRADLRLPPKPREGLRVVSWNVWRAQPMEDPGPFARVLRVLDPDVLLLQEWTSSPREIAAWLNASVPLDEGEWSVRMAAGWGVAVASRYPLEPLGHDEIYLDGHENPVRFVGALVSTPLGHLAASSVHLKCCGSSGSSEDATRISEAGAINRSLAEALAMEPIPMRIIAGDLNLVGSRPPLDVLRNGLDADGSDLEIADARDLGDSAYITWRDDGNAFTPGRLDYALYAGSAVRMARCFVLDARMLSDRALETAGLDRSDADASDHLPLVVDLIPQ